VKRLKLFGVLEKTTSKEKSSLVWSKKTKPVKASQLMVEKGMVGDTGFEPVTSTVCKKNKKKEKRKI